MLGSKVDSMPAKPALKDAIGWRDRMVALRDAASDSYAKAKSEALPIAVAAERESVSAASWFANSMLQVVPVYRRTGASCERVLTARPSQSLENSLSRLGVALDELYVRRRDVRAYLHWARTLQ
jgi:hypothetical protein